MAKPKQDGKRAVLYLRVSSQEQAKPGHYGLDAQEAFCRAYGQRVDYVVVAIKRDVGVSGAKEIEKRPGLSAALALCESGAADVLVCYDQDRLARKSAVFDAIRDRAVRKRFRLETAKDGQNVAARENEMSAEIKAFVASLERKLIAGRLYGGRKERSKRDGRGSGPLPYGYVRLSDGTIAIDQTAVAVICAVLQLLIQGTSYRKAADALNLAGYSTPAKSVKWTVSQVQTIARHQALYTTGLRCWDGLEAQERWPVIYPAIA